MNGRWFYCPHCQKQRNIKGSLFKVYTCPACKHKFRGIHAKLNYVWYAMLVPFSTDYEPVGETYCPYCESTIYGSDDHSSWPSVCSACGRNLPQDEVDEVKVDTPKSTGSTSNTAYTPPAYTPPAYTPPAYTPPVPAIVVGSPWSGKETRTGSCPKCNSLLMINFYPGQNHHRCPQCREGIDISKW